MHLTLESKECFLDQGNLRRSEMVYVALFTKITLNPSIEDNARKASREAMDTGNIKFGSMADWGRFHVLGGNRRHFD